MNEMSVTVREETFSGTTGIDYETVTEYMTHLGKVDNSFRDALNRLLLEFLGASEYARFDAFRGECRKTRAPLTITEATDLGMKVIEAEARRPTRASSDSSPGRATNGDGSTAGSTSPATATDQPLSLSAVS